MSTPIRIVTVSPQQGTDEVLRHIRRWCANSGESVLAGDIQSVEKEVSLTAAFQRIQDAGDSTKSILIPIGFSEGDVLQQINRIPERRKDLEIIVRPPRPAPRPEQDDLPTCSLLNGPRLVLVQHPIPAIRKSLIRLRLSDRVTLRYLTKPEELRRYFSLRYQVWKELGYLPPKRDCSQTRMEVDYTDRTALPIGAFDEANELVGCARLVFARQSDIHGHPEYTKVIRKLIEESGSEQLERNYARPPYMLHPFDLLDTFKRFQRYYQRLVRLRVPKAEASRVIVAPAYRHQGLGEVLVDSLVSVAQTQKVKMLFLACQEQHHDFYRHCGFHRLPGLWSERFADVPKPSIAMALNLTKWTSRHLH